MNAKIQDLLPLVELPSRYLGTEINSVRKNSEKVLLRFALAFPDLYEIGTSHFGIQILYHILNSHDNIAAERVYAPAVDMEAQLRLSGIPISGLESGAPLKSFDIIGFSLLYELNYTNILTILELAGIPFFSSQRDEDYPLIIAGGPCTCNPEPVADFFDAVVVGDGEKVVMEMAEVWMDWKKEQTGNKETLLKKWSEIEGVYIPCFFEARFDDPDPDKLGIQTLLPRFPEYTKINRAILPDLNSSPFPDSPVIPFGRPIHDRLRIELARGCTRGCRFCQAGMIYRPVRERSQETLLELVESAIESTGYEDMSLLSLSTGDYSCIASLMKQLIGRCIQDNIAISLPSLRAGTLTPELMELIKKIRKTGFTIAPEAASRRLRNVINKNIVEQDIVDTVQDAFKAGWQVIKLYFMIGLPTETREDLEAIVELVKKLKQIKPFKGKAQINVSLGTFIPKPHTPFQWFPQISLSESKEKIFWLKNELKIPGVKFKWQNPEVSQLEGIWSRGDRRLSSLLVSAYKKGCRFDGWSDRFRYDLWQKTFEEQDQINIDSFSSKSHNMENPLPWDHIDIGLAKKFLKDEWDRAIQEESTEDCRNGECNSCGVCDFDTTKPVTYKEEFLEHHKESSAASDTQKQSDNFISIEVSYSKQGDAKYFGHLEMVSIFFRAIRRAGIPLKYSQGFHPMPRISFNDPLSIGIESLNECFYMAVPAHLNNIKIKNIKDAINNQLPNGLVVHNSQLAPPKSARHKNKSSAYRVTIKSGILDEKALHSFEQKNEFILTRTNKKGKIKQIDMKEAVLKIALLSSDQFEMIINNTPGKRVKPVEVLKEIFNLSDLAIKHANIVKL